MKNYILSALLLSLVLIGCQQGRNTLNSFSSTNDTLIINTVKQKGLGVFQYSASPLYTKDTSETFITTIIYPTGIENIKRSEKCVDLKTYAHYAHKKGQAFFWDKLVEDIEKNRIDTSVFLPEVNNYINILEGYVDGKRIIVVDENNNMDLTDDSIRMLEKIEWLNPDHFVECRFPISNGKEIVKEKSWINFKPEEGYDELLCGKFEHVVAEFRVDSRQFRIASINYGSSDFTYDPYLPPMLLFVLLNEEEEKKELTGTDYIQLGQFVNLNDQYYCIQDISHNGGQFTLVRENYFSKKVGTQLGMIAPDFICVTENGDTISSMNLKDKGIIVVNMCGCNGDYEIFKAYEDIVSEYGENYHVLGVDSQFSENMSGMLINSENPFNEEFYLNYRQAYCSYVSYVINKEFRIDNKFQTRKWRDFF